MKDVAIFNISVANHLVQLGYALRSIGRHHNDYNIAVFYFEYSEQLDKFLLRQYGINVR